MKLFIVVWVFLLSLYVVAQDNPGSLWNDQARSPYKDRKAQRVGDLLTVVVLESSTGVTSASTASSKKDQTTIDAGIGPLLKNIIPNWQIGNSHNSQGTGSTTRTNRLSARLTVIVRQVLPNGNLVVEGMRLVQVNKETQRIVLSGIIRPEDIRTDNTILSENIADASIQYEGKGTVGDRQRKGLLGMILSWLF
jgi:flagellar L-ring protein precursor FlgH